MLIGLGIASFLTLLNAISYFGLKVILLSLLLGVGQGLVVPLIYSSPLKLAYLYKFLLHAVISYGMTVMFAFFSGLDYNLLDITLGWLVVFALVFAYFYQRNHVAAHEINEKLNRRIRK
jgi:hypothetical protein